MEYFTSAFSLSSQTIVFAAYVTLKIYLMIVIVTLTISTTNSVQLSFAIEDILHPLHYLKIPVNEWAMTISIALRFVPSLLEELQKIMKAQASRGVDFRNGNVKDKVKSLVSLVVPMFSVAFHKADGLADAMEARAYNPRYARTRYRNYLIN
jgi:energy-coupling factor transport system permease protein